VDSGQGSRKVNKVGGERTKLKRTTYSGRRVYGGRPREVYGAQGEKSYKEHGE